ncbi:hypothetical protein [Klebsiella pneumoniae IS46]|nr:hypothetical protein [Klebsiella pneumoniae IS46]
MFFNNIKKRRASCRSTQWHHPRMKIYFPSANVLLLIKVKSI